MRNLPKGVTVGTKKTEPLIELNSDLAYKKQVRMTTEPTPTPVTNASATSAAVPSSMNTTPPNATAGPVTQTTQIGKYKVEVIRDKCIGAASCVAIAPLVFDLDEENIARIISQDGNDDDTKLLAAQSCPTAAIIVTDTTSGKQVWPPEM